MRFLKKQQNSTVQKADESNDSYLSRHDVAFEELASKGTTMDEMRAYILLRQSQLSPDDRQRIVIELRANLEYTRVCSAIRLLGSRFFGDLQGGKTAQKSKVYDANAAEEEIEKNAPIFAAQSEDYDGDLDADYMEAMLAAEDQDALQVAGFEEELDLFFQDVPELQEALTSYLEQGLAWSPRRRPEGGSSSHGNSKGSFRSGKSGKGKGRGKNSREQLLLRISRSHCKACGERGKPGSMSGGTSGTSKPEATTTVAEVAAEDQIFNMDAPQFQDAEIVESLPEDARSLAEAHFASATIADIHQRLHVLARYKNPKALHYARKKTPQTTTKRSSTTGRT